MWLARLFIREPVAALTSDPEYPAILCPSYSVLGEVVNYAIDGGTGCFTHKCPCVPNNIVSGPAGGD